MPMVEMDDIRIGQAQAGIRWLSRCMHCDLSMLLLDMIRDEWYESMIHGFWSLEMNQSKNKGSPQPEEVQNILMTSQNFTAPMAMC